MATSAMHTTTLASLNELLSSTARTSPLLWRLGTEHGEGRAYANLGNSYDNLGQHERAVEFHSKRLAIAFEVGGRAGENLLILGASILPFKSSQLLKCNWTNS
jgi:hypothetical protein